MKAQGTIASEASALAAYQDERQAETALGSSVRIVGLRARLADLWPITMIALALVLTLAWTGFLVGLLWFGIGRLI
jgi:hypothetical protein